MDIRVFSTFWLLWIKVLWTWVYKYLLEFLLSVLLSLYSEVGLLDCIVILFNILSNCYIVFHSSCTILHSRLQCLSDPISWHPCQPLLFHVFWIITILISVKWNITVVLICISLMINDVEHSFMCLLAICISLEKCLFRSSAHFWIGLFVFLLLSCMSCL